MIEGIHVTCVYDGIFTCYSTCHQLVTFYMMGISGIGIFQSTLLFRQFCATFPMLSWNAVAYKNRASMAEPKKGAGAKSKPAPAPAPAPVDSATTAQLQFEQPDRGDVIAAIAKGVSAAFSGTREIAVNLKAPEVCPLAL